jgi:hypothetical protein
MSKVSKQAANDAMCTIREAISVVGLAHDLRALEGLVRIADDLIGDSCPALIDEEDMVNLRVELVFVRRGRLKQMSQDSTAL